jgi:hypothetical protein
LTIQQSNGIAPPNSIITVLRRTAPQCQDIFEVGDERLCGAMDPGGSERGRGRRRG